MTETRRGRVPRQRRDGDDTGGYLEGTATYGELRARAIALRRQGLSRRQIRDHLKVHIHESADARQAEEFWAEHVGIDVGRLMKTSLRKHNPRTVHKNVGQDYRGCLSVRVLQSADLYRRIEGWWCGIVWGGRSPETANRT